MEYADLKDKRRYLPVLCILSLYDTGEKFVEGMFPIHMYYIASVWSDDSFCSMFCKFMFIN